jgi:hypothetical protein
MLAGNGGTMMAVMPRPGDNVHIPLPESEALRLLLQVKPTGDMPRPGTHATAAKKTIKKKTSRRNGRPKPRS